MEGMRAKMIQVKLPELERELGTRLLNLTAGLMLWFPFCRSTNHFWRFISPSFSRQHPLGEWIRDLQSLPHKQD